MIDVIANWNKSSFFGLASLVVFIGLMIAFFLWILFGITGQIRIWKAIKDYEREISDE